MRVSKEWKIALAATAATFVLVSAAQHGISQTTGSIPAPSVSSQPSVASQPVPASVPSFVDSFSDNAYAQNVKYFKTIKDEISFRTDNFPAAIAEKFSETLADFSEELPRRTNWMLPTDTGWVSAGGADLYEVHVALKATGRLKPDGKMKYGPLTLGPELMTDINNSGKRVEARFGNKILAFKSAENRDRYMELVKTGTLLELQDMQCAMAPVHPKRPHLAGATLMVVVGEEMPGKNGKPVLVQTYNSAHVAASYDTEACAAISNASFRALSEAGRTYEGAVDLVKRKRLDDMRVPAFTPINPIQNVRCAPLS
ncbi:hypothetical protein [Rhabdaerophilum sp. SD176]|uniref:hypothetical protein n=1 Tax=Rhabdaerophilum sp. SD176 TaxID=2983548 RepID=UPI0024DF6941|nr:hypothetical protein [Rhabdaerophilum sp. SD176]